MTIQSMLAAGAAVLLLTAAPALAGGPSGHGGRPGGGCGSCGGHPGGGYPGRNVNVNVNANASAYASSRAYSAVNARAYSSRSSFERGYVGGGTTYVGGGGYVEEGGYWGGYAGEARAISFAGPAPVSAPMGYAVYGFGRDYIGWRPYYPQPRPPVDCGCRHDRYEGGYRAQGYEDGYAYAQRGYQSQYVEAPPVYVESPPVYVQSPPVYVAGPQVHVAPPVVETAPPVYVESPPVYVQSPPIHVAAPQVEIAPAEVYAAPPPPLPPYEQAPSLDQYYGDLPPPGNIPPEAPPRGYYQEPGERG